MHVGDMRTLVAHPLMAMPMRVGLAGRIIRAMRVLVVLFGHMAPHVRERLVLMLVCVLLGNVKPDAEDRKDDGMINHGRSLWSTGG
jgi:hypothetical protein